jgi:hypothetical protein
MNPLPLPVTPNAPHVVVMERSDGYIGFASTRAPRELLIAANKEAIIERTEVRPVMHSESVVEQLCGGFEFDPGNRWGVIDFERAIVELDNFDPLTGRRWRLDYFVAGDRVWVKDLGKGVIKGFTLDGRFDIELENAQGAVKRVNPPRSLVKPLVRAPYAGKASPNQA